MAGLGFKDFAVGEVLTAADVDGYLMQQTVMRFADAGARGSALGTATGTAVALAEGMVTYLDSTNTVQMYDGTAWVGIGNFSASTAITATDASWTVPTLADPIVRVTVIGGGGGGGSSENSVVFNQAEPGSAGSASSVSDGTNTVTANGGPGGQAGGRNQGIPAATSDGWSAGNGGRGAAREVRATGGHGVGGQVKVAYFDTTGLTTLNVTIGAGGAGGDSTQAYDGGDGGDGVVIVEYRAG